jgi:uncharacterized membrane protein
MVMGIVFLLSIPVVPWIGVMAAGYCFGAVFKMPEQVRFRWQYMIGFGCIGSLYSQVYKYIWRPIALGFAANLVAYTFVIHKLYPYPAIIALSAYDTWPGNNNATLV